MIISEKTTEYYVIHTCSECGREWWAWRLEMFKNSFKKKLKGKALKHPQYCYKCDKSTEHKVSGLMKLQKINFSWRD